MLTRPNPDALLALQPTGKGRLKVFLGYCAGVGKTWAMLSAAHAEKDAVVAYVETHGRAETDRLLEGLELVPMREVEYHNVNLREMDLDAVLARKPQLALVDELAHTNAPGSRHAKRYQDVLELLDAGIDVFTTVNIQHLESLNDVVARITGTRVRETVPDSVLERADSVALVDLPPEDLLERLQQGRVYVPAQAQRATENFFRVGNLSALRELALRQTAAQVDGQMRSYMRSRSIPGPWPVRDRLLVAVGPSPYSERLVRSTHRLASAMEAEWIALFVDTGSDFTGQERTRVSRTLRLVETLGGTTAQTAGVNVAEAVLAYAREHNVTTVVAGKPLRRRRWGRESLMDELIRLAGDLDVFVLSADTTRQSAPRRPLPGSPPRNYLAAVLMVLAATLLCSPLSFYLQPVNLVMPFLGAVVLTAYGWGRGPSLLASVLSVLSFDFFFVPPYLTFAVSDGEYVLTFLGLLVVGLVVSTLTSRARDQARAANRREEQTAALYDLSRDLGQAQELSEIRRVVELHVGRQTGCRVWLILADQVEPTLDSHQRAVADWTFRHGREAGLGTQTLPSATVLALPVGKEGVLCLAGAVEDKTLVRAMLSQAALALERSRLVENARQAERVRTHETLQTALLNSVSHDLRIPLVSITGALSALSEEGVYQDPETRRNLLENARSEADRLNRLVGNLLQVTRLESGFLELHREPCDLVDLISTTLPVLGLPERRPVRLDLPDGLPMVSADYLLVQQVLVNLLDNALKYSTGEIEVGATMEGEVWVADRGIGVPPGEPIFDKFYRVRGTGAPGTGLGLSICKGLVEAHGGTLRVEAREGGGSIFRFNLESSGAQVQRSEGLLFEKRKTV